MGFGLRGFFQHQNSHATFPGFLVGEATLDSDTSSNSYGVAADHDLPLNGQAYGSWRRTDSGYDFAGGHTDANTDVTNIHALFRPKERLSLAMGMDYTSNLSAALQQRCRSFGPQAPWPKRSAAARSSSPR